MTHKIPSSPVGAACVFRLQAAPMELDWNNRSNFYKQVAPTGLFRKISFSFPGVNIHVWFMSVYRKHHVAFHLALSLAGSQAPAWKFLIGISSFPYDSDRQNEAWNRGFMDVGSQAGAWEPAAACPSDGCPAWSQFAPPSAFQHTQFITYPSIRHEKTVYPNNESSFIMVDNPFAFI